MTVDDVEYKEMKKTYGIIGGEIIAKLCGSLCSYDQITTPSGDHKYHFHIAMRKDVIT